MTTKQDRERAVKVYFPRAAGVPKWVENWVDLGHTGLVSDYLRELADHFAQVRTEGWNAALESIARVGP